MPQQWVQGINLADTLTATIVCIDILPQNTAFVKGQFDYFCTICTKIILETPEKLANLLFSNVEMLPVTILSCLTQVLCSHLLKCAV